MKIPVIEKCSPQLYRKLYNKGRRNGIEVSQKYRVVNDSVWEHRLSALRRHWEDTYLKLLEDEEFAKSRLRLQTLQGVLFGELLVIAAYLVGIHV